MSMDSAILAAIQRVEAKLDTLIAALAEDEDDQQMSLDGLTVSQPRDESQPL